MALIKQLPQDAGTTLTELKAYLDARLVEDESRGEAESVRKEAVLAIRYLCAKIDELRGV
jgi:hypothetical protein